METLRIKLVGEGGYTVEAPRVHARAMGAIKIETHSRLKRMFYADNVVDIKQSAFIGAEVGVQIAGTIDPTVYYRHRKVVARVGATWWDWFKARWFCGWMLRRWPVRYVNLEGEVGYSVFNIYE